jgi:hypothetical protein
MRARPQFGTLARADTPSGVGRLLRRTASFSHDFARSDHVPFWDAGLSAIQITDTANVRKCQ